MRISDWSSDVCSSDLRSVSKGAGSQTRRAIKATSRQKPSRRLSARRRSSRSKAFRLKKPCSLRGQPAKGGSPPEYRASAFGRSEEHTSELQSLMRISYAVFCLKKKNKILTNYHTS